MNLIAIKCSTCGSNAEVDQYTKSFYCEACGTTTIIEKDGYKDSYREESLEKAELLINNQNNFSEAKSKYSYLMSSYPDDPRPIIGMIRCYTHDLTEKLYIDVSPYEPIWLTGLEDRIMEMYRLYLSVETKENEKNNVSNIIIEYVNNKPIA